MGKKMRLPNGYGSVYKLSGNRRNPYAVSITTGLDMYGKQIRKIIGYSESRAKGLELLAEYKRNPYNLDFKKLTFSDIYYKVESKLEKLVDSDKMSVSNFNNLKSVFKNQLVPLHKEKILEIKTRDMQYIIDTSNLGYTTRGYIKNLCTKIFEYAIIELEIPFINNPAERLKIGEKEKSDLHKPFSDKEREILWANEAKIIVKLTLIFLYTGMRPNELFKIKISKVFIKDKYMLGGSKTKAGKNRIIPIHHKILHLIEYFYDEENEYLITINKENYTYEKYASEFKKLMKELKMKHVPYDTRHDFATRMKNAGTNEYLLKRIMGHSISDITENIYTHRNEKELVDEVNLID